MYRAFRLYSLIAIAFFAYCCNPPKKEVSTSALIADTTFHKTTIEHARQFDIKYFSSYKIVEVLQAFPGAEKGFRYLLLPKGAEVPADVRADAVVRIPVREMVSLSTTHIPALEMLGAGNILTGFPNPNLISSAALRQRIQEGKVQDLGASNGVNIEKLMALSPDMVMAYTMGPQDKSLRSLERSGIPVVLNADYLETSPLGRAEWIKFTAAFLNKEKVADSVFSFIVNRYDSLASLTQNVEEKPTVYSGVVYNGTWFMPGGKSWAAIFITDAGGKYLWSENEESGSLQLSFESVFHKAGRADFWIGAANFRSLEDLAEADSRYQHFKAWQEGNVYTYTARESAKGGNEYLELGYSRPDIVLADLIKILQPEILPGYELYFYEKLKKGNQNN